MITLARLKSALNYDKDSGVFTWKSDRSNQVRSGDVAGYSDGDGYLKITIDGEDYRAHRLAWFYSYGKWPIMIDHKNRDRNDNRLCNLRECTPVENARNRKVQGNSTSGVPGVIWNKLEKKWKVSAKIKGVRYCIGTFKDLQSAISARVDFCEKHYGDFFPAEIYNQEIKVK